MFPDLEPSKSYRHSLFITNETDGEGRPVPPVEVWRNYRPRANDENVIDDLKDGYGFAKLNLKSFWATEVVMGMLAMVFRNLVHHISTAKNGVKRRLPRPGSAFTKPRRL